MLLSVSASQLTTAVHDVREPLPGASVDAVYGRMLFDMVLTTPELERLTAEVPPAEPRISAVSGGAPLGDSAGLRLPGT